MPFAVFGYITQHVGSWFPKEEFNLCPLQWKHGDLTSGPPGKSPWLPFLMTFFELWSNLISNNKKSNFREFSAIVTSIMFSVLFIVCSTLIFQLQIYLLILSHRSFRYYYVFSFVVFLLLFLFESKEYVRRINKKEYSLEIKKK